MKARVTFPAVISQGNSLGHVSDYVVAFMLTGGTSAFWIFMVAYQESWTLPPWALALLAAITFAPIFNYAILRPLIFNSKVLLYRLKHKVKPYKIGGYHESAYLPVENLAKEFDDLLKSFDGPLPLSIYSLTNDVSKALRSFASYVAGQRQRHKNMPKDCWCSYCSSVNETSRSACATLSDAVKHLKKFTEANSSRVNSKAEGFKISPSALPLMDAVKEIQSYTNSNAKAFQSLKDYA